MESSTSSPNTTANQQGQLQFPSLEPQRRQQPNHSPDMSKHTRTNSFFAAFRSNKQQNSERGTHERTVSLGSIPKSTMGASAPGGAVQTAGSMGVQRQQTQQQQPSPRVSPAVPTTTMLQQQQSAAATYQQPLPPTPPAPNATAPVATPSSSTPASPQPVNKPQSAGPGQTPPLHPEIRSVVGLTIAHAHKIYFSGPLVRRIERQADGQRPHKDEGWTEVWAQLGGTTLSIWDMKEVQEASRQGKEVPPAYINVTDAFIQVLGSVTVPATANSPPKRYTNVLTLNTAGSNLLLFSCPSTAALISWASALRLSAWEKSRLEEIYTAHLIRITLSNRDYPTSLFRGKLEGWAQIRIAGQTDWKRVWVSISEAASPDSRASPTPGQQAQVQTIGGKKRRMSNLFSKEHNQPQSTLPERATIAMYTGMKPKEKKKPLLTMTSVSQAFAVYPERPELIPRSTLIKVEGTFGDEELAMTMKSREGWILIMPSMEQLNPNNTQSGEMLKWVIALHDAFGIYGRPQGWTWDPRDPTSLMFGYPVGPQKEHLFLDREVVESMDPRDDRTSVIRGRLRETLINFIKSPGVQGNGGPPSLPPIPGFGDQEQQGNGHQRSQSFGFGSGPQLPPLSFGDSERSQPARPLTPITERDSIMTHNVSGDNQQQSPQAASFSHQQLHQQPSLGMVQEQPTPSEVSSPPIGEEQPVLSRDLSHSPTQMTPPSPHSAPPVSSALSGPSPLTGTTMSGSPSQASFGSPTKLGQPIGRVSLDSTRTNGSIASPIVPLSPNRRGGSISSGLGSPQLSGRLPAFSSKDSHPEQHDVAPKVSGDNVLPLKQPQPSALPPQPALAPLLQPSTSANDRNSDLVNEAGALFFMQQNGEIKNASEQAPRQQPVNFDEDDSDVEPFSKAPQKQIASVGSDNISLQSSQDSSRHAPIRQTTPMALLDRPSASNTEANDIPTAKSAFSPPQPPQSGLFADPGSRLGSDRGYAGRSTLGRKPSGARAPQPISKGFSGQVAGYASSSQSQLLPSQYEDSEDEDAGDSFNSRPQKRQQSPEGKSSSSMAPAELSTNVSSQKHGIDGSASFDGGNDEVLAALAYLDVSDPTPKSVAASDSTNSAPHFEPLKAPPSPPPVAITESSAGSAFKSSFAPSKQAEERKKKAQAQQAALQAAVNKPGRANGKKGKTQTAGGWAESSDEEEEEEEEDEDEDVDSDGEPSQAIPPRMQQQQQQQQAAMLAQQQSFMAPQSSVYPSVGGGDMQSAYSHLRPPRTLPQPPMGSKPGPNDFDGQLGPRRQPSDQYTENGRKTYYDDGPQMRAKPEAPAPGAARQTVWSQVLEAGRPGANFQSPNEHTPPVRDTFVQLEPSETMTKAFTPQGLLSAGMQDKQDRSAKRQEELARETGASLINVPNKPPPPQTGLLGAITAHERERKREGGVGAALTEREREKRVAEERQRRFDEQQRQQFDQMQQGGSMYGAPYGFNPMMNPMMMGMNPMMGMAPMMTGQPGLNPMMTGGGMNPMMTGGGMNPMMGYGMMPGFNPQHLFAAQQAAQAYQNAMMAFSVAGSQVGGDGGNGGGANPQQAMNPMMTGNMAGFDPRMSMNLMGMGMMGGMGMSPQMMNPAPLGAQTTGMSHFNAQAGGVGDPGQLGLTPPGNQNLSAPNSQFNSGNNSPVGRGSSPLRQSETPQRSRPTSPGV